MKLIGYEMNFDKYIYMGFNIALLYIIIQYFLIIRAVVRILAMLYVDSAVYGVCVCKALILSIFKKAM